MRRIFPKFGLSRFLSGWSIGVATLISLNFALAAQQPPSKEVEIQREAMQKLAFLGGKWSGPVTIVRGPGEPLRMIQTEEVQYKLDGLVLLVEGKSSGSDGKPQFSALATISFDDASKTYRIRAFNDGHYLDNELTVLPDGFAWGFDSGQAHIQNTMRLTAKREWQETTEVVLGNSPPRRSVEMLLQHQP